MLEVGYTPNTAGHQAARVKRNPEYKKVMIDVAKAMEEERQRCIEELKDPMVRATASFRDRIEAINKLTSNIQLITGKPTENEHVTFEWVGDDSEDAN